jgi:two-component system OmpR family sensor kinase
VRRPADTLTGRLVLLGLVTGLVTAFAVALVSVPLVRSVAATVASERLAQQADAVSVLLRSEGVGTDDLTVVVTELQRQGVTAYVARAGANAPEGAPVDLVGSALVSGAASGSVDDPARLVEARRLTPTAVLVLEVPTSAAVSRVASPVLDRLGIALLVGLGIAIAAAAVVARRLARPLRQTQEAARRLSTGERSLRVDPGGPAEVAELAEALNGLADALERSESRQRRFLLSVSHELRTPLTAVRGYAEALADGVLDADEVTRAGQVISDEADRLDHLMSDLLALARAEAQDFELAVSDVDLATIVRTAGQAWAESARQSGHGWELDLPNPPVLARADPIRLRQVIDVLVSNALRVTPSGAPVVLAVFVADGQPTVQVRDGGPGLSDDDLPVAFDQGVLRDRYQGTRPGGSGIGLALADRLVRRMGGTVVAGHSPEGGASFTITVPPAAADVPAGVPSAP